MGTFEQLSRYLKNNPRGQARARATWAAMDKMPIAARREIVAERDYLNEPHPALDGGALLHVAALRIASGSTRHTEGEHRAEVASWRRAGRERFACLLRLLARLEGRAVKSPYPFRRAVEPEALGDGIEAGQWRALLDLWPRALWRLGTEETAGWDDATWAAWDAEREALAGRHPWLIRETEAAAIAWAKVSGDFQDGLSGELLGLAAHLGAIARANGETHIERIEKAIAWGREENARLRALEAHDGANAPKGGQEAA